MVSLITNVYIYVIAMSITMENILSLLESTLRAFLVISFHNHPRQTWSDFFEKRKEVFGAGLDTNMVI